MLSGGTFLSPKPIELIDTLWNVNLDGRNLRRCQWFELIDTLWNVNEDDPDDDPEDDPELIDTLWNVNWFRIKLSLKSCCGINRYIMECKR